MSGRFGIVVTCFVLSLASAPLRAAHAADPPPRLLWRSVPPPPVDQNRSTNLVSAIERMIVTMRTSMLLRERGSEVLGRDASTSLGVRARGPNVAGASLAVVGTGVWAVGQRSRMPPMLTFGPRVYAGGGGIGFSLRF